jgi:hypothetical protein
VLQGSRRRLPAPPRKSCASSDKALSALNTECAMTSDERLQELMARGAAADDDAVRCNERVDELNDAIIKVVGAGATVTN